MSLRNFTRLALNNYKVSVTLFLLLLLFAPVFSDLVQRWAEDPDYSHGFLVIPLCGYMIWRRRSSLASQAVNPSWGALPFLLVAVLLYLTSSFARFHTLTYASMMLAVGSLLYFLLGTRIATIMLFPVSLLLFMFPIPAAYYVYVTTPLKLLATAVSQHVIALFDIPVYREGNILYFPNTQLEVVEACSGLRSLYAFLMLAFLFCDFANSKRSRYLILLSTFPLAIAINIVRVVAVGILTYAGYTVVLTPFFHQLSGVLMFCFGLGLFCLEFALCQRFVR